MIKRRKVYRDSLVRENYNKKELRFLELKYWLRELKNEDSMKSYIYYKFLKWFKVTMSITRIRNYCIKTGRSRWILRRFLISRICFKEYMRSGKLQGIRKI